MLLKFKILCIHFEVCESILCFWTIRHTEKCPEKGANVIVMKYTLLRKQSYRLTSSTHNLKTYGQKNSSQSN